MWPHVKECWWPPESGRREEWVLPLSLWREHGPAEALVFAQWNCFQPSSFYSCERIHVCCSKPLSFVVICYGGHQEVCARVFTAAWLSLPNCTQSRCHWQQTHPAHRDSPNTPRFTHRWNAIKQAESAYSISVCNSMDESYHLLLSEKNPQLRVPYCMFPLIGRSTDNSHLWGWKSGCPWEMVIREGMVRPGRASGGNWKHAMWWFAWVSSNLWYETFQYIFFNKSWKKKEQCIILRFSRRTFNWLTHGLFYCWNNNIKIKITFYVR